MVPQLSRIIACALLLGHWMPLVAATQIMGVPCMSLREVAQQLKGTCRESVPVSQSTVKSAEHQLVFKVHQRDFMCDGHKVFLGTAVMAHEGRLWITEQDWNVTLKPILMPLTTRKAVRHIVIDPGHGGKDKGTENQALRLVEKKLTLDVALRLEKLLKQKGFKVTLIRRSDTFVDLYERSKRANACKADLFLSIHFNAVAFANASKVKGTECFVLPALGQPATGRDCLPSDSVMCPGLRANAASMRLGYVIQSALVAGLSTEDRGLKKARFAVLRDLECPGVLIESAFLSHPEEGKRVAKADYRELIAASIAQAVEAECF